MSRTKRKLPGWTTRKDREFSEEFLCKIERGLVSLPVSIGGDEHWGENAKRFIKRLRTRKDRRENKIVEQE